MTDGKYVLDDSSLDPRTLLMTDQELRAFWASNGNVIPERLLTDRERATREGAAPTSALPR